MIEFLFNPNIAYLLLVVTSLTALASVLAPGTGLLELSALALMLLTGWVMYSTAINPVALLVLLVGFIPFWMAVRSRGSQLLLLLAIGLFVVGSTFLFTQEGTWLPAVNPLVGLGVSALVSIFIWWAARRSIEAMNRPQSHDMTRLVGAVGEARTSIHQEGSVYVKGELWSAFSRIPIPANTSVRIVGRSGLILEVEPIQQKGESTL